MRRRAGGGPASEPLALRRVRRAVESAAMAANIEITCPCCDATLVIDRVSGEVLLHKAKERRAGGSLESMVAGLESQKSEMEKKFDREMASQKDRARILDERFKEAMQRAEKDDTPVWNPMDMD
jgi:hypothetical protein